MTWLQHILTRNADDAHIQPEERHNFVIEDLGQPAGWFKPHRYRYLCLRCRWTFLVENRAGDVIAVDKHDVPLDGPEGALRAGSFAVGPCPGPDGQAVEAAADSKATGRREVARAASIRRASFLKLASSERRP